MVFSRRSRNRKTTLKIRRAIILLYDSGEWTMRELADKFKVSAPRICQIVNDTYGEKEAINYAGEEE
jgi:DNA-directed RNA polymerase sigma subunit (sigma70/sigma32)